MEEKTTTPDAQKTSDGSSSNANGVLVNNTTIDVMDTKVVNNNQKEPSELVIGSIVTNSLASKATEEIKNVEEKEENVLPFSNDALDPTLNSSLSVSASTSNNNNKSQQILTVQRKDVATTSSSTNDQSDVMSPHEPFLPFSLADFVALQGKGRYPSSEQATMEANAAIVFGFREMFKVIVDRNKESGTFQESTKMVLWMMVYLH